MHGSYKKTITIPDDILAINSTSKSKIAREHYHRPTSTLLMIACRSTRMHDKVHVTILQAHRGAMRSQKLTICLVCVVRSQVVLVRVTADEVVFCFCARRVGSLNYLHRIIWCHMTPLHSSIQTSWQVRIQVRMPLESMHDAIQTRCKFHGSYIMVAKVGLLSFFVHVSNQTFNSGDQNIIVEFSDMLRLLLRKDLDFSQIILFWM